MECGSGAVGLEARVLGLVSRSVALSRLLCREAVSSPRWRLQLVIVNLYETRRRIGLDNDPLCVRTCERLVPICVHVNKK